MGEQHNIKKLIEHEKIQKSGIYFFMTNSNLNVYQRAEIELKELKQVMHSFIYHGNLAEIQNNNC